MSEINARYGRLIALLAGGLAARGLLAGRPARAAGLAGAGWPTARPTPATSQTAAAFYQQAFDANPNSVEALVGLGRSYTGLGQYARAEQALVEAREPAAERPGRDARARAHPDRLRASATAALGNLDVALDEAAARPRRSSPPAASRSTGSAGTPRRRRPIARRWRSIRPTSCC